MVTHFSNINVIRMILQNFLFGVFFSMFSRGTMYKQVIIVFNLTEESLILVVWTSLHFFDHQKTAIRSYFNPNATFFFFRQQFSNKR